MPSALDPLREETRRRLDFIASLERRRSERLARSQAGKRGAETKRSKLHRDPVYNEMVPF